MFEAIEFAAVAHRGQTRKSTDIPYISHPYAVALLVFNATQSEDLFIAALFHDILEDVPRDVCDAESIQRRFGSEVLEMVQMLSEDKVPGEDEKPWKERKLGYLKHLETGPEGVVLISVADKLHNLIATLNDYEEIGNELWNRFNAGSSEQLWFYESILQIASKRLPSSPIVTQLGDNVSKLQGVLTTD